MLYKWHIGIYHIVGYIGFGILDLSDHLGCCEQSLVQRKEGL
ncbi:46530_t:CDS:2 [Gigaspora margarita]|uniref:46530_t:CDS:1 n=1 Tax=Gigaspora margarita TaxID=4874 RepID=A0ABM8VWA8_GIGMA|nr:46530_t:CDS:2 [Gigaspora margarita]